MIIIFYAERLQETIQFLGDFVMPSFTCFVTVGEVVEYFTNVQYPDKYMRVRTVNQLYRVSQKICSITT